MPDRITRKYPQPMKDVVSDFLREMKLVSGLNTQRIFQAWDEVSGAAMYTSDKYFKDGVLSVRMLSSVARSSLSFQLDHIRTAMNEWLSSDDMFVKDAPETRYVEKIILK